MSPRPDPRAKFGATVARTEPEPPKGTVRSSVVLPHGRHHALRQRELELMAEIGAVRGVRQHVLHGLVQLALTDETTWRKLQPLVIELVREAQKG